MTTPEPTRVQIGAIILKKMCPNAERAGLPFHEESTTDDLPFEITYPIEACAVDAWTQHIEGFILTAAVHIVGHALHDGLAHVAGPIRVTMDEGNGCVYVRVHFAGALLTPDPYQWANLYQNALGHLDDNDMDIRAAAWRRARDQLPGAGAN
jgi:hypothetical protein